MPCGMACSPLCAAGPALRRERQLQRQLPPASPALLQAAATAARAAGRLGQSGAAAHHLFSARNGRQTGARVRRGAGSLGRLQMVARLKEGVW